MPSGTTTALGRAPVTIVNREFVRRFENGRDMIGRRIGPGKPATIVGIVGDVRMSARDTVVQPQIYVSYLQAYEPNIYIVVRSSLPQATLVNRVKQAIRSAYSDQAVFDVLPMDEVLSNSVNEPRYRAVLIGAFALLALVMASSGMYSVIACLVSQRTGEIAIRMALGADRGAIVRAVLGTTSAWVTAGMAFGLVLGLAASNTVRRLSDTVVSGTAGMYGIIVIVFLAVTLAAAYWPVRRASRVDPAIAFRSE